MIKAQFEYVNEKMKAAKNKADSSFDIKATATVAAFSTTATVGDGSVAAAAGNYSTAATVGEFSTAATSGAYSTAATSGDGTTTATSGYYSTAATAVTSGKDSVAIAWGYRTMAKGKVGSFLALSEYNNRREFVTTKIVMVDGKIIKADIYYTLIDGKFVETEDE